MRQLAADLDDHYEGCGYWLGNLEAIPAAAKVLEACERWEITARQVERGKWLAFDYIRGPIDSGALFPTFEEAILHAADVLAKEAMKS